MPSRNLEKTYCQEAFYHIYNRGVNKEAVFRDEQDCAVFLNLFKRYLSNKPVQDTKGREYDWLQPDIKLLAFCLMTNHFHLMIYQKSSDGMTKLLKAVMSSYGMYFNKKYSRVGPVFQGRFKASMISDDRYLYHISRYIHLNPTDYKTWPFSSLPYYVEDKTAEWLDPTKVLDLFEGGPEEYSKFLEDFEGYKSELDDLKSELAGY